MIKLNKKKLLSGLCLIISPSCVFADTCPPPPSSIDPSIRVQVSFNAKNKLYTYKYTVSNGPRSLLSIDYFSLLSPLTPSHVTAPNKWIGEFLSGGPASPPNIRWTTIAVTSGSKGAQIPLDTGTLPVPSFAIKPGSLLTGFRIDSPQPPGIGQYFAEGFTQDPSGVPSAINDEPTPNCPGWDLEKSKFLSMVTGATVAPSNPNLISVKARLRNEGGDRHSDAVDPHHPNGKIGVLVLSSRNFDASQIDPNSVKFGPGFASPITSKLIPTGTEPFPDEDEREDWEKVFDPIKSDKDDHKKGNILLTFEVKSLQIRCGLDRSLFLSGKTKDGANFAASISAPLKITGCDTKKSSPSLLKR